MESSVQSPLKLKAVLPYDPAVTEFETTRRRSPNSIQIIITQIYIKTTAGLQSLSQIRDIPTKYVEKGFQSQKTHLLHFCGIYSFGTAPLPLSTVKSAFTEARARRLIISQQLHSSGDEGGVSGFKNLGHRPTATKVGAWYKMEFL